ncbi:MAG: response regulator transcription factor [Acidobacteria bacterium]|nr:response regulator transcription factor [Acidobacteriota bacterium]
MFQNSKSLQTILSPGSMQSWNPQQSYAPMLDEKEILPILIIGAAAETGNLSRYLQADGYPVEAIEESEHGIALALSGQYRLAIFDLPFTFLNGLEALRRVRRQSLLPVLILSAEENDMERVMALELGADDYLTKPILPPELTARIRTILRRANTGVSVFSTLVKARGLELNRSDYRVKYRNEEILLTTLEFELLEYLVKKTGQIISRDELMQQVLGRQLSPNDRSVDVHISNLRKKLSATGACKIKAIRGVGYTFLLT